MAAAQWWLSSGSVLAWQWQCPSDGSSVAQWWLGSGRGMIRACQWLSSGLPVTVAQCWLGSGPVVAWQWQWHSDGSVVALMQHVLVATRGWCCLVEGPAADGLAPLGQCAQTQPPATQQIHSLQWAQHFPHPSQDSAESLVCITDPPRTASSLWVCWHQDCALGSVWSKCNLLVWGKAEAALRKKLFLMGHLPAIPSEKQRSSIQPLPLPWAQVLLRCGCGSSDPHVL